MIDLTMCHSSQSRRPDRATPATRPASRRATRRLRGRRGFTLIETALATVIIGVGVLALVQAQEAFMRSNSWSTQAATANYLANEIRELTRRLPKFDPVNGLFVDAGGTLQGWGPRASDAGPRDFAFVTAFDNIRFAYNGSTGWADGNLPGPIDAFGTVIPDIDGNGNVRTDSSGKIIPLQGWTQEVHVVKVDPFNNSTTYANSAAMPANSGTGFTGLALDKLPARVTVIVFYRGPFDSADTEMARVSWIVP